MKSVFYYYTIVYSNYQIYLTPEKKGTNYVKLQEIPEKKGNNYVSIATEDACLPGRG
jgi:hypothetical protein